MSGVASGIGVALSKSLLNRKQLDIITILRTEPSTVCAGFSVLNVQYEGIGQLLAGGEGVAELPPHKTATDYRKRKKIANGEQESLGKFGRVRTLISFSLRPVP